MPASSASATSPSVCASSHDPGGAITAACGPDGTPNAHEHDHGLEPASTSWPIAAPCARRWARAAARSNRARVPPTRPRRRGPASRSVARRAAAWRTCDASSTAAARLGGSSSAHATTSSARAGSSTARPSMPRARSAAIAVAAEAAGAMAQHAHRGARCPPTASGPCHGSFRARAMDGEMIGDALDGACAAAGSRAAAARGAPRTTGSSPSAARSRRCIDAEGIGVG